MTEDVAEPWRPHGIRDDVRQSAAYDALAEGVPVWLEPTLFAWVSDAIGNQVEVINFLDRRLRITISKSFGAYYIHEQVERMWQASDDGAKLRIVDALIHYREERMIAAAAAGLTQAAAGHRTAISSVMSALAEAGSAWTVGGAGEQTLVRRVDRTMQDQVDQVVSAGTDAARKIASAWHNFYKIHPQPNYAFGDAVLAVEAMLLPRTIPKNQGGTMGKAVAHISDTIGKWSIGGLDDPKQASGETLLAMLRTLWHCQERHANADGSITGVTQPEAEAAVSLAVTLVHWFAAGLVLKDGVAT